MWTLLVPVDNRVLFALGGFVLGLVVGYGFAVGTFSARINYLERELLMLQTRLDAHVSGHNR